MDSPAIPCCDSSARGVPHPAHPRGWTIALCRAGEIVWASDGLAELLGGGSALTLQGRPLRKLLAKNGIALGESVTSGSTAYRIADRHEEGERSVRVEVFEVPATGDVPAEELWLLSHLAPNAGRRIRAVESRDTQIESARREFSQDRDELMALLSHELRTPLTVISGYSKLLLSGHGGELSEEQRRYLEESRDSCQRLNDFVLDLLDASHDPSHAISVSLVNRPVVPAIRSVIEFFLPLLEEKNLTVEIDSPCELPLGRFDPIRIEQVLTNLLGNAVKYTKSAGEISVRVRGVSRDHQPMIEIAMVDDGPGIAQRDAQRIFEPYVRSTDDQRVGGVGLGLAICRRILDAHGGDIWVESAPGRGSRFVFLIPAVNVDDQVDDQVEC